MTKIPPMPEELRFDHESHVRLWDWLAKNPGEHKYNWPGFKGVKHPLHMCFACEATRRMAQYIDSDRDGKDCTLCPLSWPDGVCSDATRDDTLFDIWAFSSNPRNRARAARQIRDLPVNDNLERAWREIQETLRRNTPGAEGGDA